MYSQSLKSTLESQRTNGTTNNVAGRSEPEACKGEPEACKGKPETGRNSCKKLNRKKNEPHWKTKNLASTQNQFQHTRSRVQIVDLSKSLRNARIPQAKIECEPACVISAPRTSIGNSLPLSFPATPISNSGTRYCLTSHHQQLHHPKFQSSVKFMENLEKLKHFEIESISKPALKSQLDIKVGKSINLKVVFT